MPCFKDGEKYGLWLCIFSFGSSIPSPTTTIIPPILCVIRNQRLKSIPSLLDDLKKAIGMINQKDLNSCQSCSSIVTSEDRDISSLSKADYAMSQYDEPPSHTSAPTKTSRSKNQKDQKKLPEIHDRAKKKRAAAEHVASISLTDLAKYFNLPILEASRYLNVGITVLKRKCREFGIPRWPHRKIKSLDTLIVNLQEEVDRQEKENKIVAVKAALKRQKMLENEKEGLERYPFMELQKETKRFRQDIFKRRHREKLLKKKKQQLDLDEGSLRLSIPGN